MTEPFGLVRLCLPAGGLSSQGRLQMMRDNSATVVCCTPTYALRLAELAKEEGVDLAKGTVRSLIVAGEPGGNMPAIRDRIEHLWGARIFDHWGMTELGPLAVECPENPGGIHVLESECIAEILDPVSAQAGRARDRRRVGRDQPGPNRLSPFSLSHG